jgi:hypothetical protein
MLWEFGSMLWTVEGIRPIFLFSETGGSSNGYEHRPGRGRWRRAGKARAAMAVTVALGYGIFDVLDAPHESTRAKECGT